MSTGAPGGVLVLADTGREHAMHRVADLARELGRDAGTLRRWAAKHLPAADVERRPRPGGGAPELWLSEAGEAALRRPWWRLRRLPDLPVEVTASEPRLARPGQAS